MKSNLIWHLVQIVSISQNQLCWSIPFFPFLSLFYPFPSCLLNVLRTHCCTFIPYPFPSPFCPILYITHFWNPLWPVSFILSSYLLFFFSTAKELGALVINLSHNPNNAELMVSTYSTVLHTSHSSVPPAIPIFSSTTSASFLYFFHCSCPLIRKSHLNQLFFFPGVHHHKSHNSYLFSSSFTPSFSSSR